MPEEAEGTISTFSTFDYDPFFDVFAGRGRGLDRLSHDLTIDSVMPLTERKTGDGTPREQVGPLRPS
jgi:hypothetical protein